MLGILDSELIDDIHISVWDRGSIIQFGIIDSIGVILNKIVPKK